MTIFRKDSMPVHTSTPHHNKTYELAKNLLASAAPV